METTSAPAASSGCPRHPPEGHTGRHVDGRWTQQIYRFGAKVTEIKKARSCEAFGGATSRESRSKTRASLPCSPVPAYCPSFSCESDNPGL